MTTDSKVRLTLAGTKIMIFPSCTVNKLLRTFGVAMETNMALTKFSGDKLNSDNNKSLIDIPNDITSSLDSVSFEMVFRDTSVNMIEDFRSRCHLLHVSVCVYSVYVVHILNRAKQLLQSEESLSRSPVSSKKDDKPCLCVGIIGCGKLGQQIAKCLLSFGGLCPENLLISTRRPELLKDLIKQGVNCVKDNTSACEFADVLLLCTLPAQLPQLAKEIKDVIRPDCIVYSIVAGTPISKLSFLLGTTNVLTPNLSWNEKNNASGSWNCRENILTVMKTKDITDKILPQENSDNLLQIDERFPEYVAYAVMNLCTALSNLPLDEAVDMTQQLIFGDEGNILTKEEFFPKMESKSLIDLCQKSCEETPLMQKLKSSVELRKGFQKRFAEICTQLQEKEELTEWDCIRESLKAK